MKITRISPDDFDALIENTRYDTEARKILRAVIVDGRSQSSVGAEYGKFKQQINLMVKQFFERHYKGKVSTEDSLFLHSSRRVQVSIELPESLAIELDGLMGAMNSCKNKEKGYVALDMANAGVRSASNYLKAK